MFDADAGTEAVSLFGTLKLQDGRRLALQSRFVRTEVWQDATDAATVTRGLNAESNGWRYRSIMFNVTSLTGLMDAADVASAAFVPLATQASRVSLGLAGMVSTEHTGSQQDAAPGDTAQGNMPQGSIDDAVVARVWVNHVSLKWSARGTCQSMLEFETMHDDAALSLTLEMASCAVSLPAAGLSRRYQRLKIMGGHWAHAGGGPVTGGELWLEQVTARESAGRLMGLNTLSQQGVSPTDSSAGAQLANFLPPVITERWIVGLDAVGNAVFSRDQPALLLLERSRRRSGAGRAIVSGFLISEGVHQALDYRELAVVDTDVWESPESGLRYSVGWQIKVPRSVISHASSTITISSGVKNQTVRFGAQERWVGALLETTDGVGFAFAEIEPLPALDSRLVPAPAASIR